jgi:adenine-specific DNA-methyltransferase
MEVSLATVSENTAKTIPTAEPEKLDLRSHDIAEEKKAELLQLFPEIRTEGGKIDFDKLKLALGETVDVGRERYGMNWPGKADCFKTIQQPSLGTLLPRREESVNFDTTENLVIEGDNLEVLKILQKSYLGKVKMIYIDPPYNTGNDFIYPDNYSESLQTYLEYTGQVDEERRKYSTNAETDGRFHSKWLNMFFPRLYLARNLLREDGVVFISIDDHELENLRRICDEVFGEENRLGTIVWKGATDNNPTQIAVEHEYVVCYSRTKTSVGPVWKNTTDDAKELLLAEFNRIKSAGGGLLPPEELQARIRSFIRSNRESLGAIPHYDRVDSRGVYTGSRKVHNPKPGGYIYDVQHPITKKVCVPPVNGYRYPKDRMSQLISEDRILFGEDETQIIQVKEYLSDYEGKLSSVISLDSRAGSNELTNLLGTQKVFPNPKPSALLSELFDFVTVEGDIILDFFAGSGSSAHAVLALNARTQKDRKFILIQLPEPLDPAEKDQTTAASFCDSIGKPRTIAEITKERVRRVIRELNEASGRSDNKGLFETKMSLDKGFRVFRLEQSNFQGWNAEAARGDKNVLSTQLDLHIDHIREDRSSEDILYEILVKCGFVLTTPIHTLTIEGRTIYSIAKGAMLICLDRNLTHEVIKAMADLHPQRVVCLDEGFAGNDQLKTNAVQTMKVRGVTSFRTV